MLADVKRELASALRISTRMKASPCGHKTSFELASLTLEQEFAIQQAVSA